MGDLPVRPVAVCLSCEYYQLAECDPLSIAIVIHNSTREPVAWRSPLQDSQPYDVEVKGPGETEFRSVSVISDLPSTGRPKPPPLSPFRGFVIYETAYVTGDHFVLDRPGTWQVRGVVWLEGTRYESQVALVRVRSMPAGERRIAESHKMDLASALLSHGFSSDNVVAALRRCKLQTESKVLIKTIDDIIHLKDLSNIIAIADHKPAINKFLMLPTISEKRVLFRDQFLVRTARILVEGKYYSEARMILKRVHYHSSDYDSVIAAMKR